MFLIRPMCLSNLARVSTVQLSSGCCSNSAECCQDLLLGIELDLKLICDWLNLEKQVLNVWFDPKRD